MGWLDSQLRGHLSMWHGGVGLLIQANEAKQYKARAEPKAIYTQCAHARTKDQKFLAGSEVEAHNVILAAQAYASFVLLLCESPIAYKRVDVYRRSRDNRPLLKGSTERRSVANVT